MLWGDGGQIEKVGRKLLLQNLGVDRGCLNWVGGVQPFLITICFSLLFLGFSWEVWAALS